MDRNVAVWIALAAFAAGVALKASAWFRRGLSPDARRLGAARRVGAAVRGSASALVGRRAGAVLRALVLDALLQRRVLRERPARWLAHLAIFGAFTALLLMHALGRVLTTRVFPGYEPTLNPYLFLRDLLGLVLLAGVAAAAWRRGARRDRRRDTRPSDVQALLVVGLVAVSGVLLEAVKIGSYSRFRAMAAEYAAPEEEPPLAAYWAARMGTVVPGPAPDPALVARGRELHEASCAGCHAAPASGFVAWSVAAALRPVAPQLDRAGVPRALFGIHFLTCLVGLAILPFTKLFHALATPLSLAVNAAAPRGPLAAANVATKQMIELDACTHCCACAAHCSMAAASDAIGNADVLPAVKIAALKALAAGEDLDARTLRTVQEGVLLCTSCERCAVACPSGIDLVGLWSSARDALLDRGEPGWALLSPLSARAALAPGGAGAASREAVERPRRAIAERAGFAAQDDPGAALSPGDGRLWTALRAAPDAATAASCFGCKTCSSSCPVVQAHADPQRALGLLPHQVVYAARLGLSGLALGARILWDCLGCYQCQELCPQGVGVTDVMFRLKRLAIAEAAGERTAVGGAA